MQTLTNTKQLWVLAEFCERQSRRSITLPNRELIVGRNEMADVTIAQSSISSKHARISFVEGQMLVEDLGSRNGTYLNGKRIQTSTVAIGDLLQFANSVFRVERTGVELGDGTQEEGILPWASTLLLFDKLISEKSVIPHFQSIVQMEDRKVVGHELLARSDLDGLNNPALMFGVAERLGQQVALSEMMRSEGLRVFQGFKNSAELELFVNTHPVEVVNDRFLESLADVRADYPEASIVVEIHEAAVTDLTSMQSLRCVLDDLGMKLSYDDFGAGQGRLLELSDVPPDILKFDMQMIRNIDSASKARQDLIATLVGFAKDLNAIPLAEGVETEKEHLTCLEIGFQLGQGFYYGKPQRLS